MNKLYAGNMPIVNEHLLTPKALRIAQGKVVNDISEADWESYLLWEERCEEIASVVHFASILELDYNLVLSYNFPIYKIGESI